MARGFEPQHAGDRVFYNGREYEVVSLNRRTGLAELRGETDPTEFIPAANFDNLEFAWCPEQHGGTGRVCNEDVAQFVAWFADPANRPEVGAPEQDPEKVAQRARIAKVAQERGYVELFREDVYAPLELRLTNLGRSWFQVTGRTLLAEVGA